MNVELAKDASTGLRTEAAVLGEMGHMGVSSVGATGSHPRGGQPRGAPPGWSAHPAHHRVFSSISAPKFLTIIHSGFDHRPAHERNPSALTFFFCLFSPSFSELVFNKSSPPSQQISRHGSDGGEGDKGPSIWPYSSACG